MNEFTLEDYRNAPSGIGPLAFTWKDKPHRLVYDLIRLVDENFKLGYDEAYDEAYEDGYDAGIDEAHFYA